MSATPDHAAAGERATATAKAIARRADLIAFARLAIALVGAAAIALYLGRPGPGPFIAVIVAGGSFLALALAHARLDDLRERSRRRERYHQRGLERMQGMWSHGQDDGLSRVATGHAYALDLDVVGPRSLFALLNTAATAAGRDRLAAWLLDDGLPVDPSRSDRVRDLAARHDWRAAFFGAGADSEDATPPGTDPVGGWLEQRGSAPPRLLGPVLIALRGLAAVILIAVVWYWGGPAGLAASLLIALVYAPLDLIAGRWLVGVAEPEQARSLLLARARCLRELAALATAPNLDAGLRALATAAAEAAPALDRLAAAHEGLARRRNPLWSGWIGAILLDRWRAAFAVHAWAQQHGARYRGWTDTLATADALCCLATLAAEQGGCWPQWNDDGPALAAEDLAHPLLARDRRVGNDIVLAAGTTLLITGANASGKSTFLRTCALAVLLARCGTTVPARTCRLRRMRLATVMRVQDQGAGGLSRFQAEVAALKRVFDRLDSSGDPILVALDEILAGTNSHERHLGTEAVLGAARQRAAAVLVATHDLELCRLADADPQRVALGHFADGAGPGDDLVFDHRLRPGTVRSTNALKVMRAAGLPVGREEAPGS